MPATSLILVVAVLSAFGLIASDVYLPAMPAMAVEFHVPDWRMPQTISVYLIALAAAQLVYGPLSDRCGRRPTLVAGIACYIAGSLGCAHAGDFVGFLAWRMLEAIGAAGGLVIGRAIIADTCDRTASAKVYSIVYPLVSLSPALAPAIGAHLAERFGWRADFLFVAAFGALALGLTLALLPETRPRHARATSRSGGFAAVLGDPGFRRYTLIVCAIYCAWFVYLTQSPFLLARLGLPETVAGWLYLPLTAGIVGANLLSKRLLDRLPYDTIVALGVASFVLGGGAFALGAALHMTGVAAIVLPMVLVSVANGSSLSLAVSGAIASRHGRAATASGLVGFFQIGSASFAAFAVSALFGTGQAVLAAAILAFGATAGAAALAGLRERDAKAGAHPTKSPLLRAFVSVGFAGARLRVKPPPPHAPADRRDSSSAPSRRRPRA